jgi:hypothetical protein
MNAELWNLFSVQNPDVTLYPVSYSQHCMPSVISTRLGMFVANYKVRLTVYLWQEFFIADNLDMTVRGKTVRAYMDRINKRKKYLMLRWNFLSKKRTV